MSVSLTIVIPVYNVAPYLRACLDSVVLAAEQVDDAQSPVEIICVDDGSTDGSGAILDDYCRELCSEAHPKVRLRAIHQGNRGVSAARNAALDVASGTWIGFVDSDDMVTETRFAKVLELAARHSDAELIRMTPFVSVWDGVAESVHVKAGNEKYFTGECARRWGLHTFARFGWPFLSFVRKDFLKDERFREGVPLKEDVEFFMRLADRLACAVEAEHPSYLYTRREGSAVMRPRAYEDSRRFVMAMLELLGGDNDALFRSHVWTAISYDFIQWAVERDHSLPYDPEKCEIRAAWKRALAKVEVDLSDMHLYWRPGILHWVRTGDPGWTESTWRIRVKLGRLLGCKSGPRHG